MLGSTKNSEKRKKKHRKLIDCMTFLTWFGKEKGKGKETSRKEIENCRLKFSRQN